MNENLASLPHLEILPVIDLLEHERYDQQRTGPLIKRITQKGVRHYAEATYLFDE